MPPATPPSTPETRSMRSELPTPTPPSTSPISNIPVNVQTKINCGGILGGKNKVNKSQNSKNSKNKTKNNPNQQITSNGIRIMYTNCDQMKNKLDEIEDRIELNDPHIIAINEVKPKVTGKYSISDFNCDKHGQYKILTNNIEENIGRGQLLLVKKSLQTKEVYMETPFSECLFLEAKLQKSDRLIVALLYRSESEGEEMSDKLIELVNEVCSKGYSHVLILGDFNYRTIDWESLSSSSKVEKKFIQCISDNYLHQHVDQPTRWRGTNRPSLLDLVLTNEENMITELEYQAPVGNSDHAVLMMKFNCYAEEKVEMFVKNK